MVMVTFLDEATGTGLPHQKCNFTKEEKGRCLNKNVTVICSKKWLHQCVKTRGKNIYCR